MKITDKPVMKRLSFQKIFTNINYYKNEPKKIRILRGIGFIIFLLAFCSLLIMISTFSYKAWLYPLRSDLYFDECSYLSMAKFFKAIPVQDVISQYMLKDKSFPKIYQEFNSRLISWPLILSYPISHSEDLLFLHIFRAILMTVGTVIFFLLGYKLSGIIGGWAAAIFWVGTPLLNYWGHFFMTENPSMIFMAAAYLFFLYSSHSKLSSFLGGLFAGISTLTRFTISPLLLACPIILLATQLYTHKRKNYFVINEFAKAFSGFMIIIIPYLAFTWWLFKDPLTPFMSAHSAVNRFAINDPHYYVKNMWNEAGLFMRIGALMGIIAPLLLSIALTINKAVYKQKTTSEKITKFKNNKLKTFHLEHFKTSHQLFYLLYHFIKNSLYYILIFTALVLSASVYLVLISKIPHKLPRYLMEVFVPVIIIAAMGFGSLEKIFFSLSNFTLQTYFKNYHLKIKAGQKHFFFIAWFLNNLIVLGLLIFLGYQIWNQTFSRPFKLKYTYPDHVKKELIKKKDYRSLYRLQPEYNSWKWSINARLNAASYHKEKLKVDEQLYHGTYSAPIIDYVNSHIKDDEVFYVDWSSSTPYTAYYIKGTVMLVDHSYGYSVRSLIKLKELKYKGYIIVARDIDRDIIGEDENEIARSLNRRSLSRNKKFKLVKAFSHYLVYYYKGEPFSLKNIHKKNIGPDHQDELIAVETEEEDKAVKIKKDLLYFLYYIWDHLLKNNNGDH